MESSGTCTVYVRTWRDGQKYCKNCGQEESLHEAASVASYYDRSAAATAALPWQKHEATAPSSSVVVVDAAPKDVNLDPVWKVGMVVEGRDGNSMFDCEILQVNHADESCDVKWLCDSTVTNRLPYCALYLKD